MSNVTAKLCVACPFTSEVRMHLNVSDEWNQAQIGENKGRHLQQLRYKEKEYLGYLIDAGQLPTKEVHELYQELLHTMQTYCPGIPESSVGLVIFPQVFIA
jgi:hypothetical protein